MVRREVGDREEHRPARRIGDVGIGADVVARHDLVARGVRVVDEEASVPRVVGVERDAEKTLLAAARDELRDVEEGIGKQDAVLDHAYATGLLDDEETRRVVRRGGQAHRHRETAHDGHLRERAPRGARDADARFEPAGRRAAVAVLEAVVVALLARVEDAVAAADGQLARRGAAGAVVVAFLAGLDDAVAADGGRSAAAAVRRRGRVPREHAPAAVAREVREAGAVDVAADPEARVDGALRARDAVRPATTAARDGQRPAAEDELPDAALGRRVEVAEAGRAERAPVVRAQCDGPARADAAHLERRTDDARIAHRIHPRDDEPYPAARRGGWILQLEEPAGERMLRGVCRGERHGDDEDRGEPHAGRARTMPSRPAPPCPRAGARRPSPA